MIVNACLGADSLYVRSGARPVIEQRDVVVLLRAQQHVLEEVEVLLPLFAIHYIADNTQCNTISLG